MLHTTMTLKPVVRRKSRHQLHLVTTSYVYKSPPKWLRRNSPFLVRRRTKFDNDIFTIGLTPPLSASYEVPPLRKQNLSPPSPSYPLEPSSYLVQHLSTYDTTEPLSYNSPPTSYYWHGHSWSHSIKPHRRHS